MTQVKDSFRAAVEVLVGDGPIKARLSHAYEVYLEPLSETELPTQIAESYRELTGAMHVCSPVGRQNCVHATVQKMSSLEAARHAATILSLYGELLEQPDRAGPLKVVERAVGATPRYLTKSP